MKHLCLSLLLLLTVMLTSAADVTQFYAGTRTFASNIVVWTVTGEADVSSYIIERNGVQVYEEPSGHYTLSAGYYYIDDQPFLFNFYSLRVVFADGHSEVRAAGHVFSIWWKYSQNFFY